MDFEVMSTPRIVRVAAVQAESVDFDLQANIEKVVKYITEAAQGGAKLVGFSEVFVPGYPYWIWARSVDMELVQKYIASSLKIDSPEMRLVCATAKENNIAVFLGFVENDERSLYIAQALIGADGEIKMTRRKIKPTHMERTVFGDGSGASLNNVIDLPGIGKVGGLCCWEHSQPLLRHHTSSLGEEIHVAAWPPMLTQNPGKDLWSTSAEGAQNLTRTHSIEGGCFSLYINAVLSKKNCEVQNTTSGALFYTSGGGLTAIYAPDGSDISENTLGVEEEGLVFANLDFSEINRTKHFLDTTGHYSRPDLLWLGTDTREKKHVRLE
ncbi:aliphatic nitrilase [Phlyctema vagabunda]|uniref:nitrilase n=1 Tax=Phlyctema vagabunda TaxID=108571 RepID=A0ABR4P8P9_9HELO